MCAAARRAVRRRPAARSSAQPEGPAPASRPPRRRGGSAPIPGAAPAPLCQKGRSMRDTPACPPETGDARLHREAVDLLTLLERQERLTYLHPADGLALAGSDGERRAAVARFRRLGMRGGVPDLIVAAPGGVTGWVRL